MPLNRERIGHRYPSYRYEVSREKIREYALATGVDDARYLADDGEVVAPPTFAACFVTTRGSSWVSDPELGAHPSLVHGSQEFEFHRPVRVGDVLECTPTIANIRSVGSNEFLTAEVDCRDAATGQPVVTSRATIVFFGAAAGAGVS